MLISIFLYFSTAILLVLSPFCGIMAKFGLFSMYLCYFLSYYSLKKETFLSFFKLSTPLNQGILFFFISAVISTIFSVNPYHSQKILFNRYFLYLLCFYAGFNFITDKKSAEIFELLFCLSGFIIGLGGLIFYLLNLPVRLYFSWNVRVDIGLFSTLFLPFAFISLLKSDNSKSKRLFMFGSFCLVAVCLVLNYSRGAFISVISAIFLTLYISKNKKRGFIYWFLFLVIFLVCSYFFNSNRLRNLDTWQFRIPYIKQGLNLFKSSPIIGRGLGSFELLNFVHPAVGRHAIHVENLYVELLAQSGIFGLFAFIYLFWLYFRQFLKRLTELENYELSIISSILACLISGFFGSIIIVGLTMSFLFWFLVGVSISKLRLNKPGNA